MDETKSSQFFSELHILLRTTLCQNDFSISKRILTEMNLSEDEILDFLNELTARYLNVGCDCSLNCCQTIS